MKKRKVLPFWLIFSLSLLSCTPPKGAWEYNRGVAAYLKGQYPQALSHFRQASYQNPNLGEAFLGVGNVRMKLAKLSLGKNEKQAQAHFFAALKAYRHALYLFQNKGFLLYQKRPRWRKEIEKKLASFLRNWQEIQRPWKAAIKVPGFLLKKVIQKGDIPPYLLPLSEFFALLPPQKLLSSLWVKQHFILYHPKWYSLLEKSLEKNPRLTSLLFLKGLWHIWKGKPRQALEIWRSLPKKLFLSLGKQWEKAVQIAREFALLHQKFSKESPAFAKQWEKLLKKERRFSPAFLSYAQGVKAWTEGHYLTSEKFFRATVGREPSFGEARFYLHLSSLLGRGDSQALEELSKLTQTQGVKWYFFSPKRLAKIRKVFQKKQQIHFQLIQKEDFYVPW